jgi:hypothetical protein
VAARCEPPTSGDIEAPLAAVAIIAAAPPSFCGAAPGSSLELHVARPETRHATLANT